MRRGLCVFIALLCVAMAAAGPAPAAEGSAQAQDLQQWGTLHGSVADKQTRRPLPRVSVVVEGTRLGAATDTTGVFRITRVPVGAHNVRFMMIGFETLVKSSVVVNPDRETWVEAALLESPLKMNSIQVRASYFEKARDAVVTTRTMDFEEIRQDPGSSEDIQRVMQALPAVVSGSDQVNEIIVRGGIPGENLFLMDGIEIPNPNHFATQGTSGGPISMINTHFVRQVDFLAGAFPAKFGDKVSSVMDIALREGNRARMESTFDMGLAGVGGMIEGPLGAGSGSYLLSARKSYLDLIISSTGLTAVPHYYSLQGKVVYDLGENSKLLVNAIYGSDRITIEKEKEDEESAAYVGNQGDVRTQSHQHAVGAALKSLWSKGFTDLTVSRALNFWDSSVYNAAGDLYYTNRSAEAENTAKLDWVCQFSRTHQLSAGAAYKQVDADYDMWVDADTLFLWDVADPDSFHLDTVSDTLRVYDAWENKDEVRSGKVAAYVQHKWRPSSRVALSVGLRYDRFAYTNRAHVGPRGSISFTLTPSAALNIAYGDQYQSPAYSDLTAHPHNRTLDCKRTHQVVVGVEHLFREDTKATVETYYKEYSGVAMPRSWTTPDPYDRSEGELVNKGTGDARGIEFFLQRKTSGRFQGTLSYSYSRSRALDPRFGEYYDWDYDYRHVFTAISTYRWKLLNRPWYQRLRAKPWYKVLAFIIPLADETVVSARWRYLGGRPYTEPTYIRQVHTWITGEDQRLNSLRLKPYHRLDLRLDRRFMFRGWNMVTYVDLQNVYNRDNVWGYQYHEDGSKEEVLQFKVFPIGGLAIEF